MRILAVNVGSTSLKLSLVGSDDQVLADVHVGADVDVLETLRDFVSGAGDFDAVAHRLVHGGPSIRQATLVDDAVRRRLDDAATVAPPRAPPALGLRDPARESFARPRVVCGDPPSPAALPLPAAT